jgi:hypothetical protein
VWTCVANGSELEGNEDADRCFTEWNNASFVLLAYCQPSLTLCEEVALTAIIGLPDEAFFDVTAVFLRVVDSVYFGYSAFQNAQCVHIRTMLFKRIENTRPGSGMCERSTSTEMHFGPARRVSV